MIPHFDDNGYLPPGVHPATLEEVEARFGQDSELRQVQMQSLRWLIDLARRAGISRVLIDGSFVSNEREPNDVDCALLTAPEFPRDLDAAEELDDGLPFIQLYVVEQEEYDYFARRFFATDADHVPKGMIEVSL